MFAKRAKFVKNANFSLPIIRLRLPKSKNAKKKSLPFRIIYKDCMRNRR